MDSHVDSHESERRRHIRVDAIAARDRYCSRALRMEEEGDLHEAAVWMRRAIEAEEDAHRLSG